MFLEHLWLLDYICGVREDWGVENTHILSLSCHSFPEYIEICVRLYILVRSIF